MKKINCFFFFFYYYVTYVFIHILFREIIARAFILLIFYACIKIILKNNTFFYVPALLYIVRYRKTMPR